MIGTIFKLFEQCMKSTSRFNLDIYQKLSSFMDRKSNTMIF